ncbi:hypothetical protein MMC09_001042 [Bachmanniomyces sp. S44760]|nr:hypothetical protein [Bachmanniomyces sp. S44760]
MTNNGLSKQDNQRFATYCPFCQVSTTPSALPPGLRDPPAYSPPPSPRPAHATLAIPPSADPPPSYTPNATPSESQPPHSSGQEQDTIHHLHPNDSVTSLSLAYSVPIPILRRTNNLWSDHLLHARKTLSVPATHYTGPSLSAKPILGEEEEERRNKVRKWMVACKEPGYNVAVLYLEQNGYLLDKAVKAFREDERWEREHPLEGKGKEKGKRRRLGGIGITGQLG